MTGFEPFPELAGSKTPRSAEITDATVAAIAIWIISDPEWPPPNAGWPVL
jgi:hypothetical protein